MYNTTSRSATSYFSAPSTVLLVSLDISGMGGGIDGLEYWEAAVVTAPWTVVGGNLAKFIKKRVLKDVQALMQRI